MAAFLSPMSLFQLTTSRRGRRLFFYFVFTLVTFQLTTSRRGRPVTDTTAPYISTFQLTTSRRGRRFRALRNAFHFCISTHDLTKRSTCAPRTAASFSAFQLTTSRRGRRIVDGEIQIFVGFQLTTSRRGRPIYTRTDKHVHLTKIVPCRSFCYFNSRPHEEVDQKWLRQAHRSSISTHDLTKRSTRKRMFRRIKFIISTHDLTKRSTVDAPQTVYHIRDFNSRPHEEVDAGKPLVFRFLVLFQLTTSRRGRLQLQ